MQETKICPYCGEEIKTIAIKCKHCGSMLTSSGVPTEEITPETQVRLALADKYEIIEEIGRGGMASVYKAVQKNINKIVTIKVLHQNLIHDDEFIERFDREAKSGGSLKHSNVVEIYDVARQNNIHYMVMEYLDGKDLHRIIREKGKLGVQETINIITQMAEALDYAHKKGLVHRDVKSSNIIITKEGRAVLTDFGIAHAASGTKLTQTGTVIGTPEYMSPEQAEGKEVDGRGDLYSLGVVMYECLTGRVPFKGDNPLTTIHSIIYDTPQEVKGLNREIPEWLNETVNKLLSKNKEERYITGWHLTEKLKAGGNDRPKSKTPKAVEIDKTRKIGIKEKEDAAKEKTANKRGGQKERERRKLLPVTYIVSAALVILLIVLGYLLINRNTGTITILANMVYVNGGWFEMGSNNGDSDEKPVHRVYVDDFIISKYEVTFAEYDKFCEATGRNKPSDNGFGRGNRPVINVTWKDAIAYSKWLSRETGKKYRLPTEAEWEYAARGGNKSKGYKYSGSNNLNEVSWYWGNSEGKTHLVGEKKANELGIYDMSGNVWEWNSDWYDEDYYDKSPDRNPVGPGSGTPKVLRGGSWDNSDNYSRVALRNGNIPGFRYYTYGFRYVQDL